MFTTQAHLRLHGKRLIELEEEEEEEEEWRSWFCMGMSCFLGFVTSHEIPLFPSQQVTYFCFHMSPFSH